MDKNIKNCKQFFFCLGFLHVLFKNQRKAWEGKATPL